MKLRLASVAAALGIFLSSAAAHAAPAWQYANASEDDMRDSMDVATTHKLQPGTVPVLSRFGLRFTNGDHELRRIGVLARSQTATMSLADQNNDDPFTAFATWAVVGEGKAGKVSAVGGGVFEIPIPDRPLRDHTLVLSGFEFRRQDKTDNNVRAIGVWLDTERRIARVSLIDDQGPDFAPFVKALGEVIMNLATMGVYEAAKSHGDAVKKLNDGKKINGFRPYAVTVQYAWIPNSLIEEQGVMTGTSKKPSSNMKLIGNMGLTGFEMAFTNSDHHLMELAVQPFLTSLPGLQVGAGEVRFQDSNEDDPKKWAVGFVQLK